jgi:serine/threonine protein kinase/DNA-binding winged helix-turn-helix (wHTH) protein
MADSLLRPGSTQEQDQIYVFGACEFDESRLELRVQGRLADLELKPMEVLRVLLQRGDQVSSKEELLKAVWPGLSVVDGSLATAVSKLRKALGDEDSSLVRTVQRVGYRLGVPVECRTIVGRASAAAAPNTFPLQQGAAVPGRESWKLLRALDTTASTEVWLAENPKTREQRVFKFANSDGRLRSLKREVTVSRFLRETLGEPPHFVRIFEWNFERAPYYLESEYGGQNLAEWAATGSQLSGCSLGVRLQLITAVARAVADAHAAGVIHQDLKPTNILIAPAAGGGWNVKVSDFGSASLIEPKRLAQMGITNLGYTRTAETVSSLSGTLLYMAPEVLSGNPPTAASDVYALGVMLYQIVVGDFRRPLSPGWESQIDDPLLREDIAEAAFGDPARRVKSAAEFADRLASIDVRKRERDVRDEQRRLQLAEEQHRREMRARRPWMLAAAAALLLAVLVAIFAVRRTNSMTPAQGGAVAILPFQNSAADPSLNFLSLAIPNELETQLSYSQSLPIRPFALTSHFTQSNPDLHKIGQDLKVSRAVTGMYLRNGQNLAITLEAIDLVTNQVLWRRTLNVPQNDFRSMQGQLAGVARTELAQSLGAKGITTDIAAHPASAEAYDGYLRSLAIAYEPSAVNRQGVALLEDSVRGDPNYAPAWQELGRREYSEFRYANGGPAAEQRWVDALNQVLRIDPGNAQAMTSLVVRQVEKGQLAPALAQARELVRRIARRGRARMRNRFRHRSLRLSIMLGRLSATRQPCACHRLYPDSRRQRLGQRHDDSHAGPRGQTRRSCQNSAAAYSRMGELQSSSGLRQPRAAVANFSFGRRRATFRRSRDQLFCRFASRLLRAKIRRVANAASRDRREVLLVSRARHRSILRPHPPRAGICLRAFCRNGLPARRAF